MILVDQVVELIDATRPIVDAPGSVVEHMQRVEDRGTELLRELVALAERLPTSSPLRDLLQLQARELINFFSRQGAVRYSAYTAERSQKS